MQYRNKSVKESHALRTRTSKRCKNEQSFAVAGSFERVALCKSNDRHPKLKSEIINTIVGTRLGANSLLFFHSFYSCGCPYLFGFLYL